MLSKYSTIILVILFIFLNMYSQTNIIYASQSYISEDLYIIPWGEQDEAISRAWKDYLDAEGDFVDPPDSLAISDDGYLVIEQYNGESHRLTYFSNSGSLIANVQDLFQPYEIAISNNDYILMSRDEKLALIDQELNVVRTDEVPGPDGKTNIYGLYPSNNNTFWILFYVERTNGGIIIMDIYKGEFGLNGFCSSPILIYSGEDTEGYTFVTPDGEVKATVEDMYGYKYVIDNTPSLYRYSPGGGLVFDYTSVSDPGLTEFDDAANRYLITWSGDFYTIRATDEGAVVTKFRLNVDPICSLVVVTPMPLEPQPAPFAVEFDASGTTDPNGDDLTYEWSFDGDLIFNEPVDDAYTGEPNHPTHLYYEDFDGPVIVRVKDPYDGECQASVHIHIDIE